MGFGGGGGFGLGVVAAEGAGYVADCFAARVVDGSSVGVGVGACACARARARRGGF